MELCIGLKMLGADEEIDDPSWPKRLLTKIDLSSHTLSSLTPGANAMAVVELLEWPPKENGL